MGNGAGGGVGSAAVQIATRLGADVTAICSTKDVDKVNEMGANLVIDRTKNPNTLSKCKKGQFDIIFDTANALPAAKSLKYLKPKGILVLTGPTIGHLWGFIRSLFTTKQIKFFIVESKRDDLKLAGNWLQDDFKVYIDSTYKIKDIERALVRNREKKDGRVVIEVKNGW